MRRLLLPVLVAAIALPSAAQRHPFSFEDMMALKRVEEPIPSPDGKWVLFAAVDVDLKANTKTPHVWVVPISGGKEREIISDQDADRPRWAPDGKRFAFVSTKEGGSQVWIADFDGAAGTVTNVFKLTSIATEAGGELWSPDGKNILFTSDGYPECDGDPLPEADCNAKRLKEAAESKVKALIFDHLLYRHWNAYKGGKRKHIFVVPVLTVLQPGEGTGAGTGLGTLVLARDLTPGDYDVPPFSLGGQDNYAFSPDGQEICFASNHDPVEAISTNKDLFTVPVLGADASSAQVLAQTKNITADNKAADETPLYSPDGKCIAYRAQARPGDESDRWGLMLYDRKTGVKKNLTEDLDRWVGSFTWSPNSVRIYFTGEEQGKSKVLSVLVETGQRLAFFLPMGSMDDLAVTPNGVDLLFTNNSLVEPNAINRYLLCPNGTNNPCSHLPSPPPTKLSQLNDAILSQVSMSPLEPFWFTGANNDKVQGFLVKPPNFDPSRKYPVKFLIHGGPEGAWGDDWSYRWNPELFAANGYVVVMINFHGSTGYGQKFIDAINGDWGGAPFEDLMRGLDYAEEHYSFIDKTRECALGASYGGYMANWILGHTNRFKCIVSHDSTFNTESAWGSTEELWFPEWEFKGPLYANRELYRKWSPHLFATSFKTPTLVVHGQLDYRLDVSEGVQLFTTLQRQGVPSKMLYFPDEGHWVLKPQNSQLWYKTVSDWVDQWVGK
jgi:dipeptidyl aminopeptidase/acylaminoacyl peptidase